MKALYDARWRAQMFRVLTKLLSAIFDTWLDTADATEKLTQYVYYNEAPIFI